MYLYIINAIVLGENYLSYDLLFEDRSRGCAECSLEPISTKDLLKWAVNGEQNGGGGIRKKPTNYGKYSIEMVNILPNAGFLQPHQYEGRKRKGISIQHSAQSE